ncbi:MAG: DNA polymerase III subunit delta' C-terminal domain-containing protein [Planctomycetota bacterium]
MSIKEVFSQDKAISLLQRALAAQKVPHSYIFAGPEGVGRFKTALEWAKVLLCKDRIQSPRPDIRTSGAESFDSCGQCESCRLFVSGAHPDFHHVYKELQPYTRQGKGKPPPVQLPIDVIREFLIEKISAKPIVSNAKVFVVSEAEKLNNASQNALLKVLEEPAGNSFIILICTRLDKLLPTTQSRCQIVRFGPIEEQRIIEKLNTLGCDKSQALYWSRFSQGSLGMAMIWAKLDGEEGAVYRFKKELIERLAGYTLADALDFAEWIVNSAKRFSSELADIQKDTSKTDINRVVLKNIIRMISAAFSDAMKVAGGISAELVNSDQARLINKLSEKFDTDSAAQKVEKTYKSMGWVDANVNEKLIIEELLLNLVNPDTIRFWG